MSYLPVTALKERMPVAPQPGGQTFVWQADVQPDYARHPAYPERQQRLEHHLDARKLCLKNPELVEGLVPHSEREGTNKDGISRKLAWLARNGYTVVSIQTYVHIKVAINSTPPTSIHTKKYSRLGLHHKSHKRNVVAWQTKRNT
jgi:hypothetical protein